MSRRKTLSDEIKKAIEDSDLSRYAICKELGYSQSLMSRFMGGTRGVSVEFLDSLAELLDLHVVVGRGQGSSQRTSRSSRRKGR